MQRIIGLFDNPHDAHEVVRELRTSGLDSDGIGLIAPDENGEAKSLDADGHNKGDMTAKAAGTGAAIGGIGGILVGLSGFLIPGAGLVLAAGPIASAIAGGAVGAAAGGLVGALTGMGVGEDDAHFYAESVRRGGTLVTADVDDYEVDRYSMIFDRHGAVDIDNRAELYRNEGFNRFDSDTQPFDRDERIAHRERLSPGGQFAVPVIEENVSVGKRAIERGRVRIISRIIERPIEEQVTLREERIDIERRPVDRPISTDDMKAFEEGSVEFRETTEEAVVNKEARVVEEVVVHRDVEERQETIRETARRTDVDVERDGSGRRTSRRADSRSLESDTTLDPNRSTDLDRDMPLDPTTRI